MEQSSQQTNQEVNSISFDQDQLTMHICTDQGFKIFKLDPISLVLQREIEGGTLLVQSLLQFGYVFIVNSNKNFTYNSYTLIIWERKKQEILKTYEYTEQIKGLQLSNRLLILVFPSQIQCRTINNELVHSIETFYNTEAIYSVSFSVSFCIVAPTKDQGVVQISWLKQKNNQIAQEKTPIVPSLDQFTCELSQSIKCNESGIKVLSLNFMGNILAVASLTGTVIRLFDTKSLQKIREFRRGSQPTLIQYISFSLDDTILSCCSQKDTIHLFKVNETNTTSYFGMLSYFLPIAGDQWSFAQIQVPKSETVDVNYKLIIKQGYVLIVNNYQEYIAIQLPEQGIVQATMLQALI